MSHGTRRSLIDPPMGWDVMNTTEDLGAVASGASGTANPTHPVYIISLSLSLSWVCPN